MKVSEFGGIQAPAVIAVCAALLLTGCEQQGDAYEVPDMRLSDRFGTRIADKYSVILPMRPVTEADRQWWKQFNDPVLNQLVDQALADSPTLAQAQARIREASA